MTDDRRWPQMTLAEYHEAEGISSGALRVCESEGVLGWWSKYVARRDVREETDPLRLGAAFHAGMEKPDGWQEAYVRIPACYEEDEFFRAIYRALTASGSKAQRPDPGEEVKTGTKFGQLYYGMWRDKAAAEGKDFLTADDVELVERQIRAVWDNPACREYLEQDGIPERACFWTCPKSGLTVKAIADRDMPQANCFLEFKTTRAKNAHDFLRREFRTYGLAYQAAFYRYVLGRNFSKIITVTGRDKAGRNPAAVEAMLYDVPWEWIEAEYDKNIEHLLKMAGLLRQAEGSDVDRDGIPIVFHNEFWGAEIDPLEILTDDAALMAKAGKW